MFSSSDVLLDALTRRQKRVARRRRQTPRRIVDQPDLVERDLGPQPPLGEVHRHNHFGRNASLSSIDAPRVTRPNERRRPSAFAKLDDVSEYPERSDSADLSVGPSAMTRNIAASALPSLGSHHSTRSAPDGGGSYGPTKHTSQHSDKVSEHSGLIARELGLDLDQVDEIMLAAAMHDIGKIGMRNDILFKPGTLTDQERELAKRHADIGGDLLQKFPMFENGAAYVRHHHERWDGTGYPDKLQGEAIPLGARIIAVADSYQAMTEQRPYRAPLSEEAALQELRNGAGTQFDPNVVEAFFRAKGLASVTTDAPALIPAPTAVSLAEST